MKDFRIPEKYGVLQPIGDTVMAGGISRALRQIPAVLDIAADIHELCPGALFVNYANPMSAICRAVVRAGAHPVIGLCHAIQGTVGYLCSLIDVPTEQVEALYMGVNHMTWVTHLTLDGESLWPRIEAAVERLGDDADNPFSWDLYRAFGAFPADRDPHVIEFFPEYFPDRDYYGKHWGQDTLWCPDFMVESGAEEFARMEAIARGEAPIDASLYGRRRGRMEALVPILDSVQTDAGAVFPINVPNSTVPGIPPGFVLEMPVAVYAERFAPQLLPALSPGLLGTVCEQLYGIEITVEAALTGDRRQVVQALLFDRCVTSRRVAEDLADDLLLAHAPHLPQFR
jgi:alpha-galactosidase